VAVAVQPNSMLDKIKLAIAALAAIAGIWGFYYLGAYPGIVRLGAILGGVVVAILVGATSEPGKRFFVYARESIDEAKKVVWPSRRETMQLTGVVVAFVIVMALFLWGVDATLNWLVQVLIGRGA
jgi:preprotein translocase subunit SecE